MFSPERLLQIHRQIKGRRLKALVVNALRVAGLRHMVVRMDTTNLCNLRCKMCYYSSDYLRKRDDMSPDLFRRIAAQVFPKARFLYLSCATEPLMNRNFPDLLRIAGEYRVPFMSFCTNGQLLRAELVQAAIEAKLSEVIFSIDGATAETYEHIRVGAKWSRLLENINLLKSIKAQAGVEYPVARINFTCMQRNIGELPAMVRFASDYGIRSLHVRHLLSYMDAANTCREEMNYQKVFNTLADEARREAAVRGIDIFLPDPVPSPAVSSGKSCVTNPDRESNPYCLLPWAQAIISWNGDYRICSSHRELGNLAKQTFEDIYNSPRLIEIRRNMLGRTASSCSWNCREEAYEAMEVAAEEDVNSLIAIGSSTQP